jgi:predicted transcriptional regulator
MASTILVKDIMSKDVKVVRPDTSVQEVVATLNKFNIGSVVVIQKDKPVASLLSVTFWSESWNST